MAPQVGLSVLKDAVVADRETNRRRSLCVNSPASNEVVMDASQTRVDVTR